MVTADSDCDIGAFWRNPVGVGICSAATQGSSQARNLGLRRRNPFGIGMGAVLGLMRPLQGRVVWTAFPGVFDILATGLEPYGVGTEVGIWWARSFG